MQAKPNPFPLIMVVEDDLAMENMICEFLEAQGFQCWPQRWATEALKTLKSSATRPALIISDLHMPGMTGYQFIEALKAEQIEVPVLLITAFGSKVGEQEALQKGARSYLPKPFRLFDLLSEVKKLLNPAA